MTEWPALPYEEWRATRDTLHMYTQVLGKLRLALSPFEPEWNNVPLYVTARGLTTSTVPVGSRAIDAELDLLGHELVLRSSDGMIERRPLGGDVAAFYRDVMRMLEKMRVEVSLSVVPSEVPDPIPFPDDHTHDTYVPEQAARFFRVLSLVDVAMKDFRARFRGRTSLVEFFWGTFDLSLMRFSGRRVEPPADAGFIRRIAGDAEAICVGWWPGDERVKHPSFFAYGYPAPEGIERAPIRPAGAAWSEESGEFLMPYEFIRTEVEPQKPIRDFFDATYEAAAGLMGWDPGLTDVVAPIRGRSEEVSR